MPVFPAIFERVAGNLLSVDGSATQLPAILLAILLGVNAPLMTQILANYCTSILITQTQLGFLTALS